MLTRAKCTPNGVEIVPLTPEEVALREAEEAEALAETIEVEAEKNRLAEIKASTLITDIEDAVRNKPFAEIDAFLDGMTTEQRDKAFKGLLLKWALSVR